MRKYLFIITAVFFLSLSIPCIAFSNNLTGITTGIGFLELGAGAKELGMGNAVTSIAGHCAGMIYWNPAAIAALRRKEISLMHSYYLGEFSYDCAAFVIPSRYGVFGGAFQYFSRGKHERENNENRNPSSVFFNCDSAIYLSYGKYYRFNDLNKLNYGLNLKYIYSKIDNSLRQLLAADMGFIYSIENDVMSFGFVMQNFGVKSKKKGLLPLNFKLGASRYLLDSFLISAEVVLFPYNNKIFPAVGGQYMIGINNEISAILRTGYNGQETNSAFFSGFNAGFGVKYRNIMIDYSFSPYGSLGIAHRVSISIKFGKNYADNVNAKMRGQTRKNLSKFRNIVQEEK